MFSRRGAEVILPKILLLIFIFSLILGAGHMGKILYPFTFRDPIFYYSRQYNIDPYLLAAIIKTESNFDPFAISPKGACGLMQLMPQTGEWVAKKIGYPSFSRDILFAPEINIQLGAWYLADLQHEFQGNLILTLAAYNGGLGNIKKWLAESSYQAIRVDKLPFSETRQFVRKVLWNYKVYICLYSKLGLEEKRTIKSMTSLIMASWHRKGFH